MSLVTLLALEAAVLLFLVLWLALRPTPGRTLATSAALVALVATAGFLWSSQQHRRVLSQTALADEIPAPGEKAAYVTSDTCASCHPGEYASWHSTYHRTMTRPATPEYVKADFHDVTLGSGSWAYSLERRDDEYWVEMVDPDWERLNRLRGADVETVSNPPRVERRIVMITGSHHMQTFWVPSEFGRELINLPFVYLFEDQRWVAREDVFLRPPEAGRFLDLWNDNCIECHSTVGVPGLEDGSEAFETAAVELGIACEACHGPAQEHVRENRNPFRRYALHFRDQGDPTIVQPARLPSKRASEVCGQCHGVGLSDARKWLQEGHSYQPGEHLAESRFLVLPAQNGDHPRIQRMLSQEPLAVESRFWSDGKVRVSGREFSGMVESACYKKGELSCLSCHSMHDSDPNDQLAAGREGNDACFQCHDDYRARLEEHTHHPSASAGSQCYNCHMPHTSYGLLTAMRSHTIDSPSVTNTLETGRPNACNLCHLDKSLEWTSQHLSSWFGQPLPPLSADQAEVAASISWALEGDAGQRALAAWSLGWQPALEASGDGWQAPFLGHLLNDPYAAVRYVAQRSLRRLPAFEGLQYDYVGPSSERAKARGAVIDRWLQLPWDPDGFRGPQVLMSFDGNLRTEAIGRLSSRRNDRPVALGE